MDEPPSETAEKAPEPAEPEPDPAPAEQEASEPDPLEELSLDDELSEDEPVAMEDADDLLGEADDVTTLDFDDDEDVSQDDIDALLMDTDDDEDDEDILISQDDIDTLLMAADQEDEDVLGDLMDEGTDLDDDFDDEDILESEDPQDEADDADQVVLEGDTDTSSDQPVEKKKKKKKIKLGSLPDWLKSKVVIIAASVLVFLGITIPLSYFLFFSAEKAPQPVATAPSGGTPGPEPIAEISRETQREIEIETVSVSARDDVIERKPGNMVMEGFVILAADRSRELAYITADISIDYSDQRAYHDIQDNLPFYRDLIYDSLRKSILAENGDQLTEADMLEIVETALKRVLPGNLIQRVSFKTFKTS